MEGRKITSLQLGESYIGDVPSLDVKRAIDSGRFDATTDFDGLRVSDQDCIVITTDHSGVDYKAMRDSGVLIFDTRNVMGRLGLEGPNVAKL